MYSPLRLVSKVPLQMFQEALNDAWSGCLNLWLSQVTTEWVKESRVF